MDKVDVEELKSFDQTPVLFISVHQNNETVECCPEYLEQWVKTVEMTPSKKIDFECFVFISFVRKCAVPIFNLPKTISR